MCETVALPSIIHSNSNTSGRGGGLGRRGSGAFGGVEGGVSYMIKFAFDQGKPFY